jgi:hypothetical protein
MDSDEEDEDSSLGERRDLSTWTITIPHVIMESKYVSITS